MSLINKAKECIFKILFVAFIGWNVWSEWDGKPVLQGWWVVCPCTVFPVSRATDQPGDSAEMSASFNSFYVFLFVFLNKNICI